MIDHEPHSLPWPEMDLHFLPWPVAPKLVRLPVDFPRTEANSGKRLAIYTTRLGPVRDTDDENDNAVRLSEMIISSRLSATEV